jgi:GTP pyrophosphokinase
MAASLDSILARVRRYHPGADFELLRRAHDYATEKHGWTYPKDPETPPEHTPTLRKSGEPYITHPIEVAAILADLEMDPSSIAAAFLHDVIEDCRTSREEIAEAFGEEIATLVDGVTKLKLADFERLAPELAQAAREAAEKKEAAPDPKKKKRLEARSSAENLRKILLAMARDWRVMVIKLADRLHNMRTLDGLSEERRKKVAEETMQIFAPLAHRLGIWQVKWQLEDLAFKALYPTEFKDLAERLARTRKEREKDIRDATFRLKTAFEGTGLSAEVTGRPKHLWSIFNKMRQHELDLSEIFDLTALRVITETVPECYAALGIVHQVYMPIPGKFDDYIAKKKSNLYQSLHTKVYGPRGEPLEVQIRTMEMHRTAEFGVAAHWAYKERGEAARAGRDEFERKMAFLRQQLFEWQKDSRDSSEFLSRASSDLFTDQVFIFTPKGDVIDLPSGATPVDVAYRIHSGVGEHCYGAKVNGKMVPINHQVSNGDIVEILTRPQARPSLDWLTFTKSGHARSKIKNYFRKLKHEESVEHGRRAVLEELQRLGLPTDPLKDQKKLTAIAQTFNKTTGDDLLAAVGFGDIALGTVVNKLRPDEREGDAIKIVRRSGEDKGKLTIAAGGVDGVAISRAKCCLPLPGDPVVGYVSRGKGMILHRDGCANVAHWRTDDAERPRLVEVDWSAAENARYNTGLVFETLDRTGLLNDVTAIFSESKTFILGIQTHSNRNRSTARFRIDFDAPSVEAVDLLIRKLHGVEDLLLIHRLGVGADELTPPDTAN